MSFFSSALVFFGMIIKFCNTRFLIKIKHKYKNWATIIIWVISIGFLLLSKFCKVFALSILASVLVGLGTGMGDITVLGFMKCFPPIIISGYSSGTGMSGIVGASLYLIFKSFNVSFTKTVLSLLAFYPVYGLCFFLVIRMKLEMDALENEYIEQMPEKNQSLISENEEILSQSSDRILVDHQSELEDKESKMNQILTWEVFWFIFSKIWPLLCSFLLLYFFEYMCLTSISSQLKLKYQDKYGPTQPWVVKLLFEILQLSYQIGIFTTRSSLDLIKIQRIWVLLVILLLLFTSMFVQTLVNVTPGIWLPIVNIFFVGITGGFGYANICHQVLKSPKIKKSEREISMNVTSMFSDLGIILNSVIGYLFSFIWRKIN